MVSSRIDNTNVGDAFLTLVNSESEWNPSTATFDNTSATQRPGALTFDYKRRFEIGPIERGDTSDSLFSKVWRVRRDGLVFYIARENEEGDDWREEEELFRIDEESVLPDEEPAQFGFSFDQNGRPTLSFSLSGEVYIWWFDPQQNEQVIRYLDDGTTPIIYLDERRRSFIPISDLLVFYVDTDNNLVFRQQRDRYDTVYSTPVSADETLSVELLYKSFDTRLVCAYTRFDEDRSVYTLDFLISVIYGIKVDPESFDTPALELNSISLKNIDLGNEQLTTSSLAFESVNFNSVLQISTIDDPEELGTAGLEFVEASINNVLVVETIEDIEEVAPASLGFETINLNTVVIEVTINEPETFKTASLELESVNLE